MSEVYNKKKRVGIVGSGLIGKSWAMIFASAGYQVNLYDVDPKQLEKALVEISAEIDKFEREGVLRGKEDKDSKTIISGKEQKGLIKAVTTMEECVRDVVYVQECVPEILELKRAVWKEIDEAVGDDVVLVGEDSRRDQLILAKDRRDQLILASSSSCIVPSKISEGMGRNRERFIVAHPINPPYHAPMVEIVPAPWTSPRTRSGTRATMLEIGQVPVSLSVELDGFIANRIQFALLNECWRLVAAGVVSAEDLDVVMRDGLGLRYAFMGPMETIHLNADGVKNYVDKYGKTIYDVSKDMGEIPTAWTQRTEKDKDEVERVRRQLEELYPLDKLNERRSRRDKCLAALSMLKKELPK